VKYFGEQYKPPELRKILASEIAKLKYLNTEAEAEEKQQTPNTPQLSLSMFR
jgi:hypothetical protein